MVKNISTTNEEVLEEKRATARTMGLRYMLDEDIGDYEKMLRDKLDDLSNGQDPYVVSIRDAEVKGQIYAITEIKRIFDKYKK